MPSHKNCFNCGKSGEELFGYILCNTCKSNLGLFTDATLKKHIAIYNNSNNNRTYKEEIEYRLKSLEKDYIKKRIKLLYIKYRLDHI